MYSKIKELHADRRNDIQTIDKKSKNKVICESANKLVTLKNKPKQNIE